MAPGFSATVESAAGASMAWVERHRRLSEAARFLRAHWLATLAGISLAGLLLAVNPLRIAGLVAGANRRALLLMAGCVVAIYLFKGIGWCVTLRRIGLRISLGRAIYVMFVGRTLIFVPTGDLARIALLSEGRERAGEIAGTIAFQELVYTGLVGLGVLPRIADHPQLIVLVAAMAAAHAGVFAILLWKRAYDWALGLVRKVRLLRRFDSQLVRLRPAFVRMTTPSVLLQVLLWDACAVLSLMALFYLAVVAVAGPHVSFAQTTFAYGLGHTLGGLSLLPSGVGAMEAIIAGLLVTQGVPFYAGVAAVILFRVYNDLFSASLGAVAGLVGGRLAPSLRRVQVFSNT